MVPSVTSINPHARRCLECSKPIEPTELAPTVDPLRREVQLMTAVAWDLGYCSTHCSSLGVWRKIERGQAWWQKAVHNG